MRGGSRITWAGLLACLTCAIATPVSGQGLSDEAALFLLLPVGPKAVSMGRAVTALPGAESTWWNPAGLGELASNQVLFFRTENVGGATTAASFVLARSGLGSLGVAYELFDLGEQETTDEFGNPTGTISFRNHQAMVSVASRFWDRVSVGVNLKCVREGTSCRGPCEFQGSGDDATTFALDAGVQVSDLGGLPLRLGAVLVHAGPDIQFENADQADPLPTRLRFAAAYELLEHWLEDDQLRLWLTSELEVDPIQAKDGDGEDVGGIEPAGYLGAELTAGTVESLSLRAGWVFNSITQVDGGAVGLGLRYESFDLAIAKSLAQAPLARDDEPIHVSFGFVF
jgi:hypothetical protein